MAEQEKQITLIAKLTLSWQMTLRWVLGLWVRPRVQADADGNIGIGDDNRKRWLKSGKCCFLPEEREWFEKLSAWGLMDTYRLINPDEDARFSWFDYRSKGFDKEPKKGLRIDVIMATAPLAKTCVAADIDYEIRAMQKPSDHCPVWARFDCNLA